MSQLDDIIRKVKENGSHEESQAILNNAYFKGDDRIEKLQAWAKSVGLTVFIDDYHLSYLFRSEKQALPTQDLPEQK